MLGAPGYLHADDCPQRALSPQTVQQTPGWLRIVPAVLFRSLNEGRRYCCSDTRLMARPSQPLSCCKTRVCYPVTFEWPVSVRVELVERVEAQNRRFVTGNTKEVVTASLDKSLALWRLQVQLFKFARCQLPALTPYLPLICSYARIVVLHC